MPKSQSGDKILPGELRVLEALSKNTSYKQMPDVLFISSKTANTHMRNSRKRNKVNNNVALLRIALEEGEFKLKIKNRGSDEADNNFKLKFYSLMNYTP